ncbi:MAG TPA: alpha-glucan family phosphorylase, partial [Candidatus Binatia bacterium]|nr:alpha-glucan family phosphorylase [Candidatus Binatia bacterium]
IAYFTMDVAIDPAIPTYSGGLGVLSGDMIRSAADFGLPFVAVTLLYRKGYCDQRLDSYGNQSEVPSPWSPEEILQPLAPRVRLSIEGRRVTVRAWQYLYAGVTGHVVPVLFLDTDLEENDPQDRILTDNLYGGDERYRLCQEVVLGFGGFAMIRAIKRSEPCIFHMNEGHAAFVPLALLEESTGGQRSHGFSETELDAVRRQCVFTTHTPVPAGHDRFDRNLVRQVLGDARVETLSQMRVLNADLNMTELALRFSGFVNGVSMRHGEISRDMFPGYRVDAITNGVHAVTWTSPPFRSLFDRALTGWRHDSCYLRHAIGIPISEIRKAHAQAKKDLVQQVRWLTGTQLNETAFIVGFARRATAYKRADLLFSNLERLQGIANRAGPMQVVYAGKAHPRDEAGKAMIRRVFEAAAAVNTEVRVVYLQNYDMSLGKLLCAGADLWLNTPIRPLEASGTSGMKAALNGVPSLSVLDGWWIEGHIEGVTGWSIGTADGSGNDAYHESLALYDKLEHIILPLFYKDPEKFAEVMRSAIAFNGSFFNTQRMIFQYLRNAYLPACSNLPRPLA